MKKSDRDNLWLAACYGGGFITVGFLILFVFLMLILCAGCGRKVVEPTIVEREHIVTNTRTEFVTDTVFVDIPAQTAQVVVLDSVSVLENDYATTTARINPNGTLSHTLATKPQSVPVEHPAQVIYKDSLVYMNKEVQVSIPVATPLTKWQRTAITWFPWAVMLLALAVAGIFRKPIFAIIRRFI